MTPKRKVNDETKPTLTILDKLDRYDSPPISESASGSDDFKPDIQPRTPTKKTKASSPKRTPTTPKSAKSAKSAKSSPSKGNVNVDDSGMTPKGKLFLMQWETGVVALRKDDATEHVSQCRKGQEG